MMQPVLRLQAFLLLALLLGLLSSCDDLDPPYTREEDPTPNDTTTTEILERFVVLESYTGVKCSNCPAANDIVKDLKARFGKNLIVMKLHCEQSGQLSKPFLGVSEFDLRSETASEINRALSVGGAIPNGTVNRKRWNGNMVLNPGDWIAPIETYLEEEAPARISFSSTYNATNRTVDLTVTVDSARALMPDDFLVVYFLQDSIIDFQLDNEQGEIPEYTHNSVLRGAFNGTWGEDLYPNDTVASSVTRTMRFTIPDDGNGWNPRYSKAVGILYRGTESYEILQAGMSDYFLSE